MTHLTRVAKPFSLSYAVLDGPGRDRTCDLGIKSPLLYQLSYRPFASILEAMSKGYMEGPAAEAAEARRDAMERGEVAPERAPERSAVYGSTADDAEPHFLGWRDEVDPDELFASGKAWGISVIRKTDPR